MYDMKITTVRQVPARRAPAIDLYIDGKLRDDIYERWGTGVSKFGWPTPISMRGGINTITVKMIREIPRKELEKVYFKRRTKKLLEATARVVVV